MIRHATVVKVENGELSLLIDQQPGCSTCSTSGHCASGKLLPQTDSDKADALKIHSDIDVKAGDRIELSVPEKTLRWMALKAYGMPLLAFISGALFGSKLANDMALNADVLSLLGAVLLTAIALAFNWRLYGQDSLWKPGDAIQIRLLDKNTG